MLRMRPERVALAGKYHIPCLTDRFLALQLRCRQTRRPTTTESARTTLPEARLTPWCPSQKVTQARYTPGADDGAEQVGRRARDLIRHQRCAPCPLKRRDRMYLVL